MIKSKKKLCILFAVVLTYSVHAQEDTVKKGLDAITHQAVQGQLEFLASDWTRGRGTGDPGSYMAADYIASMFKVYGLQPGGDLETIYPSREERSAGVEPRQVRTFFQNLELIEYYPGEEQSLSISSDYRGTVEKINFVFKTDFFVNTSDVGMELSSPIVFVGYGMVDEKNRYDDFAGLDVKGKVILRLAGFPGHKDPDSDAYNKFHSDDPSFVSDLYREKLNVAEEKGVAAVIEITREGNPSTGWADNIPFRYNLPFYEGDKPLREVYTRMKLPGDEIGSWRSTISVTMRVANQILKGTGVDMDTYEEKVMKSMKPASKILTGKSIEIKTTVNSRIVRERNVIGVLEGMDPDKVVVVGGHYDHLGELKGYIWNGSDDNASGTVGVLTLAKACMATGVQPEYTIVFAAWTAEEKGLLGSHFFVDHPYVPAENIQFYLNYDMISRDAPTDTMMVEASLTYTEAYPELEEMTFNHIRRYNLSLKPAFRSMEKPRGGSDYSSFAAKDVPILTFNAGFTSDYHQITDHSSKANIEKMTDIIKVGFLNVWKIANTPGFRR